MANSPTESTPIDRLSHLPEALLITILSFLPTHIAARTCVLCRSFRHLWEASPSLALISLDLPHPQFKNFVSMAKRALLDRNASYPLVSLHLEVSRCDRNASFLSSFLVKARSLHLRHLTIDGFYSSYFSAIPPIIFTINSLRYLSLDRLTAPVKFQEYNFTFGITLTCLRSLSLKLIYTDPAKLNQLVSELCSLKDLHLDMRNMPGLNLSSQTVKNLKLIIHKKLDNVVLSLPSLESLHLETHCGLQCLSTIHVEVPLLRKAVINLHDLNERDVSVVARLLNYVTHVEELSLHIKESEYARYPILILSESGKHVPHFSNLKHLDWILCFHKRNIEVVTTMLHNCPILESLKLVHEGLGKTRKCWESKLPRNADGNYCDAYFRNLHLKENRKEIIKLLSNKCSSKRQSLKLVTWACIYSPAKCSQFH